MTMGVSADELPLARLYRWERERPDRLFLTQPYGGGKLREWTWEQTAREVRRMAGHLKAQNWEPGSRIAILSKNCAWWIMADLAIWMAGHVSVPIYSSLRAHTMRQILEHSDAKACFLGGIDEKEAAALAIPAGVASIRFPSAPAGAGPDWDSVVAATPAMEGAPARAADDIATIFYTSGTTGEPKGVMHRFTAFAFQTTALGRRLDLEGELRVLSYLPLAHILERGGLELPAIQLGWHVFFTEGVDTFLADLRRARPTAIFLSVPRVLLKLQQGVFEKIPKQRLDRLLRLPVAGRVIGKRVLNQLGLDEVRYAASGAAPLPLEVLLWYRKLGLNLIEGYGLTEAMITHLTTPGDVRPGYVGGVLDGVEMRRSETGEMLLRSPMNMAGYYKDPDSTRETITADGFVRTGDLVDVDAAGQVKIIGRLKEQFKTSKGKYVAPAPIETKLAAHPDVESCCLMGTGFPSPFAVLVLTAEARQRAADPVQRKALETSLRERLEQVNGQLAPHERVAFLAIVDGPWTIGNGLMTPTLKLRRAPLEQQYLAQAEEWKAEGRQVVWVGERPKTRAGGAEAV